MDDVYDLFKRGTELLEAAGCEEGVNTSIYLQSRIAQRRGDPSEAAALAARTDGAGNR